MAWEKGIKKRKNETELEFYLRDLMFDVEGMRRELRLIESGGARTSRFQGYSAAELETFIARKLKREGKLRQAIANGFTTRPEFLVFLGTWDFVD